MTNRIDTAIPEFRGWTADHARSYEMQNNPMGRRASPREIAQVILGVLNGPDYMTGSIVKVNGGR